MPGISVYNCYFYDCAARGVPGSGGMGDLCIWQTKGTLVHDNYFSNNSSATTNHGVQLNTVTGIQTHAGGFGNYGLKIYNNTFTRHPLDIQDTGYCYSLEIWQLYAECEIYNNTFDYGGIDPVGISKEGGSYGLSIHDNTFTIPSPVAYYVQSGINLECEAASDTVNLSTIEDVNIYKNTFTNIPSGILIDKNYYNADTASHIYNINIYENVFDNIGGTDYSANPQKSFAFQVRGIDQTNQRFNNINFLNNTIISSGNLAYGALWAVYGSSNSNIRIDNNIFYGIDKGQSPVLFWAETSGVNTTNISSIENNDYYNCNGTTLYTNGVIMNNKTEQNSIIANPLFFSSSNYNLQQGSPDRKSTR